MTYGPQTRFAQELHATKYRAPGESFEESMNRVAAALTESSEEFHAVRDVMRAQRFLPGGRIQSAVGSPKQVTPYNCLDAGTRFVTREHGVIDLATAYEHGTVTVLDGDGVWQPAQINEFGIRDVTEVRLTSGHISRSVWATSDHRWILEDGTETTTSALRRNHRVAYLSAGAEVSETDTDYCDGVSHGIVYGDGSAQHGRRYQVRLCGAKRVLEQYLPARSVTYPASCDGDPFVTLESDANLKALPTGMSAAYLRGFMRGWLATDGCVSAQPEVTICMGPMEVSWCTRWAPVAGFHPIGWSRLTSATNYGSRNKESGNLRFDRASLGASDFLMAHHRSRFVQRKASWRVASIGDTRKGVTYCPRVLSTSSFVLEGGIHTGQCFVSGTIDDSFVEGSGSIMARASEAATTMRMGGGIGYDFSTLRPRGATIRKLDSSSSGPVSFMTIFDSICKCIASSGHRRGAQMGVMRVDHPDVEEFIHAKQNRERLTGFNVSVAITDEFMQAVETGDQFALRWGGETYRHVDARALWDKIMRSTWDWAEPGVLFIDQINRMNNLAYCETIAATNPCVVGGTPILSRDGWTSIESQVGCTVDVWNGHNWTSVQPRVTGKNVETVRVQFSDGSHLDCTTNHRFSLSPDGRAVEASNLAIGDRLERFSFPVVESGEVVDSRTAYTHGFYSGDGSKEALRERDSIWLYGEKRKLSKHLVHAGASDCAGDRTFLKLEAGEWDKTFVPLGWSLEGRLAWLAGLADSDGSVQRKEPGDWPTLVISSVDHEFLMDVKRMCHTLGLDVSLRPMKAEVKKMMPDGRGGQKEYECKESFRVLVSPWSVWRLATLGFETNRIELPARTDEPIRRYLVSVTAVEPRGIEETVYCFTDHTRGKGIFGCVSTRQCGEQPLPPHGACLLGSFNLTKYVAHDGFDFEQFAADIPPIVAAMDQVVDVATYPMFEQEQEAHKKRRMGLGITGLANAGEALGYRYGSAPFLTFMEDVLRVLRDAAYRASIELAKERGPFPLFNADKYLASGFALTLPEDIREDIRKHGIRNSHLLSIAPTGTISMCADNVSSGIEPVFSARTRRTVQTFDGPVEEVLEDYGLRTWSVEPTECADVTAHEHLGVLGVATQFVDSAVSKTCNIPSTMEWDDFKQFYMSAWKIGAKGCTTYRLGGKREGILKAEPEEGGACKIDAETGRRDCD